MSLGILGKKVGSSQLYMENGEVVPVTVIKAGPCCVLQIKNMQRDGYEAVQLGYEDKRRTLASKAERGHVAKIESKRAKKLSAAGIEETPKAGCEPKKFIKEFRTSIENYSVGQEIQVDIFEEVHSVDITAISKGSGYSGVMKRHNFAGQRATHGVKKCHRHLGSTGCSAYPGRTPKGKKMPGQCGNEKVTLRNQKVVYVDKENNLLLIRGGVPGPNGGYVTIKPTNFLPAPKTNKWRIPKKVAAEAVQEASDE